MSSFTSPNDLLQCVSNNNFYHHYKSKINSENVHTHPWHLTHLDLISIFSPSIYLLSMLKPSNLSISLSSHIPHPPKVPSYSPQSLTPHHTALHQPPQRSNLLGHLKQTIQRSAKNSLRPPRRNASPRFKNRFEWSESTAITGSGWTVHGVSEVGFGVEDARGWGWGWGEDGTVMGDSREREMHWDWSLEGAELSLVCFDLPC